MTMRLPAGQAPAPVLPFEYGSRLRYKRVEPAAAFPLDGADVNIELPRVAYALGLRVVVSGPAVVSTATLVPKGAGIWNYLRRAVVDTPGLRSPIRCSGDTLHVDNLLQHGLSMEKVVGAEPVAASGLDANAWAAANLRAQAALGVGTNTWRFPYWIPLTRSIRDLRGMRALGHGGQHTFLTLTPSAEADLITTVANLTTAGITVTVDLFYFDAPPPGVGRPDTRWAIILEDFREKIASVGAPGHKVGVDPEGIILDVASRVVVNDAPSSADINNVSLELDGKLEHNEVPFELHSWIQERERETFLPVGVVAYDFDKYQADPEPVDASTGARRGREHLYSDEFEDINPTIQLNAAAVLGGGQLDFVMTAVRRLAFVPEASES